MRVLGQFIKTAPDSYAVCAKRTRAKRAYSYSLTLLKIAPSYMNAHTLTRSHAHTLTRSHTHTLTR